MLACDFAVAASSARFGLTSVRNGLLAGVAIPVLIEAVGPRVARQLMMHGGIFDAETALRIGVVDQVVGPTTSMRPWRRSAGELKLGAPSVQTTIKKLITRDRRPAARTEAPTSWASTSPTSASPTRRSKAWGLLDKRKPKWAP